MLKEAITGMLGDTHNLQYGQLFFRHHLIDGFQNKKSKRLPQYISSAMFADVLIDVIGGQSINEVSLERTPTSDEENSFEIIPGSDGTSTPVDRFASPTDLFKKGLDEMAESPFRDMLASYYAKSDGDYTELKTLLETWYNDQMDRVSGWYKTRQKKKFLIAGFVVAIVLNVDSLFLIKVLSLNENLRANLVNVAEGVADDYAELTEEQKQSTKYQLKVLQDNIQKPSSTPDSTQLVVDTVSLNSYVTKLEALLGKLDTLETEKYKQSKQIVALASELNIPIGWNKNYAPISWWSPDKFQQEEKSDDPLMMYLYERNSQIGWQYGFLYVIGIIITGYSLSFGAPFWFEILMKLVNIRRAGSKPLVSKPSKN